MAAATCLALVLALGLAVFSAAGDAHAAQPECGGSASHVEYAITADTTIASSALDCQSATGAEAPCPAESACAAVCAAGMSALLSTESIEHRPFAPPAWPIPGAQGVLKRELVPETPPPIG